VITSGTARVPTLWIVLGPLGQSITVAGLLGTDAALAVDRNLADGMNVFAVLYGVPVWGFAVLWIGLATALTVRTLRRGMPFALTWWSLTFPVGTFVTGTTQLAAHTGLPAFRIAACDRLGAGELVHPGPPEGGRTPVGGSLAPVPGDGGDGRTGGCRARAVVAGDGAGAGGVGRGLRRWLAGSYPRWPAGTLW